MSSGFVVAAIVGHYWNIWDIRSDTALTSDPGNDRGSVSDFWRDNTLAERSWSGISDFGSNNTLVVLSGHGNDRGSCGDLWRDNTLVRPSGSDHIWNTSDIWSDTALVVHSGTGNDRNSVGDLWRDNTLTERSVSDIIWNISDIRSHIWSHIWNVKNIWSDTTLVLNNYERLLHSGTGNDRGSIGDLWRDNTLAERSGSDIIWSISDIWSHTTFFFLNDCERLVHSDPGNDRGSVSDLWRDNTLAERSGSDMT
jgi:hypothetical protein